MRIIEKEGKYGILLFIIIALICLYFGLNILALATAFFLLVWLFLCSSKLINPTTPKGIVSPINGRVKDVSKENGKITFTIETLRNGRIYAPADLKNICMTHISGFYFFRKNKLASTLGAQEHLSANAMLGDNTLNLKIEMFPRLFKISNLNHNGDEALFLEKIGFLNMGSMKIEVQGENIESNISQGDKVKGGITTLVSLTKPA